MTFTRGPRNLTLTAHIVTSLGFLGAVGCFLALAIDGLAGSAPATLRAIYLSLDLLTWLMIVPLCFAAVITGVISALGTPWGLFRHYWVLAKLLLMILTTAVLMLHTRPIAYMAHMAAMPGFSPGDFVRQRVQLVVASGAAVVVLLGATILSVYKPKGMTRYGWRKSANASAVQDIGR